MGIGLFSSLRARLIAVMILGLGATAFAVVALTSLARTSREQRVLRAHERVEAELERMAEGTQRLGRTQRLRHGRRGAGELRSGYVEDPAAIDSPRLREIIGRVAESGQLTLDESVGPDDVPMIMGAAGVDGGGYVWAVQRVVIGPEMKSLRFTILCLSVAMIVLVLSSIHTLVSFDRGTRLLLGSVGALARDLHTEVPRPKLRELAEVADRLDTLARDLARAEEDKVRLLRDLSEHERWAALGRVVAGVAHEVRNPLAAIKLRADLAETNLELPPALRDDFAMIGSEVARLDRLVRDLLLLTGRRSANHVETDLRELVEQRLNVLRPWAREKEVTLEGSGAARAPLDVDAMTRAIDNLIRNAVEASHAHDVVRVAVDAPGDRAEVLVEDSGQGVPQEHAALLFEPFFTTKTGGTGLGLALSRSVAEAHGGTLTYRRVDGKTRFSLDVVAMPEARG